MRLEAVFSLWRRRYRLWRADAAAGVDGDARAPVVVITGGSDGIGFALAEQFARGGDRVLLVSRQATRLAAPAAAVRASPRVHVDVLALDVTRADAAARIAAHLSDTGGYCDVLVNCAGLGAAGHVVSIDAEALDAIVALNVAALTRLTRAFLPDMLERGRGGVLNVASVGGYAPGPYQAVYYASKAYVLSFTEALAQECVGQGVRISVLVPGPVRTAFHRRMAGERGFYLRVMPVASPGGIARAAVWRFRLGQRVIVPGVVAPVLMLALRAVPHPVSQPIVAWLLKPRGRRQG